MPCPKFSMPTFGPSPNHIPNIIKVGHTVPEKCSGQKTTDGERQTPHRHWIFKVYRLRKIAEDFQHGGFKQLRAKRANQAVTRGVHGDPGDWPPGEGCKGAQENFVFWELKMHNFKWINLTFDHNKFAYLESSVALTATFISRMTQFQRVADLW